jgi:hypothetical protein
MHVSRSLLCILIGLAVISAPVLATGSKEKPTVPGPPSFTRGDTKESEAEPNNNCGQADGPIGIGIGWEGQITPADVDYFRFEAEPNQIVVFQTFDTPGQPAVDPRVIQYADDCTTQLAANDDSGLGLHPQINRYFSTGGTFYVVVRGFDDFSEGYYTLVAETYPMAENNHCGAAIDLYEQGMQQFVINTCTGTNVYNPGASSCTGYEMLGPDLVYKIILGGNQLDVYLESDNDLALYLVNSCEDVSLSCVAGVDDGGAGVVETLTYSAIDSGDYYLIIDSEGECGMAHLVIVSPTESQPQSWGEVKSRYR